jgi:hypothetical protein
MSFASSGSEPADAGAASFENGIPDREILAPLSPMSPSSAHNSFHTGSSEGVSPQEWNALATAGYNPYFPIQPDHNMYNSVTIT